MRTHYRTTVRQIALIPELSASLAGCIVFCGLSPQADAQTRIYATFATTSVYDEQWTNTENNLQNAVDAEAAGNNLPLVNFKTGVPSSWALGLGGVVDFDQDTFSHDGGNAFIALYGPQLNSQLVVSRLDGPAFGLNINNNNPVISGHNYLGFNGSPQPVTLEFSAPLTQFAVTCLSRGAERAVQMKIVYDDLSEYAFPSETIGAFDDDTVFIHQAPEPRMISQVVWMSSGSPNAFTRWDDLAFVVAPPFPCGTAEECAEYFGTLRDNFGNRGVSVSQGDLTKDGLVDLHDYRRWRELSEAFAPGAPVISAVPEPVLNICHALLAWRMLARRSKSAISKK